MTAYGSNHLFARGKPIAAFLLCVSLGLGGCAGHRAMQVAAVPATPLPPPSSPPLQAAPAMMAPLAVMPPPAPLPPAPPPVPNDATSLRAAYGTPDFVRREADSELWRYDTKGCAAFFFLYRDGDLLRLRYAETTPHGRDMPADPACIQNLLHRPPAALSQRMS